MAYVYGQLYIVPGRKIECCDKFPRSFLKSYPGTQIAVIRKEDFEKFLGAKE
jgi:hypothetical protein